MKQYEYGNKSSQTVLLQAVNEHELSVIENEAATISSLAGKDFRLIALEVNDWNRDLSPWDSPAVFGNENFGDGAADTLKEFLRICNEIGDGHDFYIGGYSLAGLFSLWAAYQTDRFMGVAAASPSMWFPGFVDFMRKNKIMTHSVYLSLGDKEEKTRNPVMATVGGRIREAQENLMSAGIRCTLEWNKGNHFKDADKRTASAFAWLIK